ncbi:PTS sugar transporter subunit IIA [Aquibacillus sp. 3ASR75-11]|uniref:PTS sugar transporter subunit IIA n=1 Tax=Terrihalobacillus insolitus TaxID=2950438 RepID=A0A9X3WTZ2_9BACI|nr:PTS sugar transporter subunit IIA [Terrihalobacillus insolitus]MDC3424578.1 PTS sugar transporter subunit IIA [Terrihalobacillus insolitus]
MNIDDELIMINLEAESKERALSVLGSRLHEEGYVTDDFVKSVMEREQVYPTGLPTSPYGLAIPHTDSDKVIKPKIAFATLKEPIKFSSMSNMEEEVDVKIIFMLALKNPHEQLEILQKLTGIFQDSDAVTRIANVETSEEFHQLLGSFV